MPLNNLRAFLQMTRQIVVAAAAARCHWFWKWLPHSKRVGLFCIWHKEVEWQLCNVRFAHSVTRNHAAKYLFTHSVEQKVCICKTKSRGFRLVSDANVDRFRACFQSNRQQLTCAGSSVCHCVRSARCTIVLARSSPNAEQTNSCVEVSHFQN